MNQYSFPLWSAEKTGQQRLKKIFTALSLFRKTEKNAVTYGYLCDIKENQSFPFQSASIFSFHCMKKSCFGRKKI